MSKKKLFIIIASITAILVAIVTTFMLINNKNDKLITYKVIFDSNGGTEIKEQIINEGNYVKKPNDPIKEGYLFVEWQYNNILFDFNTKIDKDITLIAKWQELEEEIEMITIKFDTDGGTTISNQIIEKGSKIIKPEEPTKEGYIFKGWYYNNEEFNFDTSINEDIEIKVKWEEKPKEEKPIEKKYAVIFNSNGGSEIKKQEVKKDSKATKPNNPTKDNHIFIEWTLDGKNYDFNTKVTKDITLIAKWVLIGDVNSDNVINGKDTTLLMRYISGWDEKISLIAADLNNDNVIDDIDVAVLRKYLAGSFDKLPYNSGTKYTISYNLNGGTFSKNEYVYKKYAAISLPYTLEKPTKEGYVFIGWTGSNGNTPQLNIEISKGTTGNLQYNANWLLYGDVNNDNKIDIADSTIIRRYIWGIQDLTKMQKTVSDVNQDSVVDDIDVDIISKYLSKEIDKLPYNSGEKYTIIYNLNGGNFEDDDDIREKYSSISLPYTLRKPEKEGYIFIGWTGSNGNTPQIKVTIQKGTIGNLEYDASWGLYGDINDDNTIDIADSIIIQQYIEGTKELTENQKKIADVNLDGKVNNTDVDIIRNYLAKVINKLPYTS